jgi:hypothetical protein
VASNDTTIPTAAPGEPDQAAGIAAVVEPIKAIGALVGFGIGFLTAHRTGADVTDSAIHGLVGAVLLFIIAWYLGLTLVREVMLRHVEEQRAIYAERVEEMKARAEGQDLGVTLPQAVPRATLSPRSQS